jgi:hypothetical protein
MNPDPLIGRHISIRIHGSKQNRGERLLNCQADRFAAGLGGCMIQTGHSDIPYQLSAISYRH